MLVQIGTGRRRAVARGIALLGAFLLALAAMAVPQQAVADPHVPLTITADSGSGLLIVASGNVGEGVNGATGTQIWAASNQNMTVKINPGSGSLGTNQCFDSFFDWERSSGHFDIRIARTCDTGYSVNSGNQNDCCNSLIGANRLATCKGTINNTVAGTCNNHAYADMSIEDAADTLSDSYKCARGWVVEKGGRGPLYYSGGSSTSCSS